jgi:hypothetical protein
MCQYPNCITRAWPTDSFADSTRAEDRVDEHCGVEGHSVIRRLPKPLLLALMFFLMAAVCRA